MVLGFFIQGAAAEPDEQQLLVDKARVTFDGFMKDQNQIYLPDTTKIWYLDMVQGSRCFYNANMHVQGCVPG